MPAVQKQFDEFHSQIRLDEDNEKAKLREKRETLLKALRANLPADVPRFENFNQGSYSMHTGVVPLDGNYDIDVGLIFDCKRDKYPDPISLKSKVRDALDTHGRRVNIRRPCVTVNYMVGDVVDYHVDLAVYVKRDDGLLDLAKGRETSEQSKRVWEISDPKQLTSKICDAFQDEDELAQYRRCIRYMKRWRDVQFSSGAPLSIALTVAAHLWFKPHMETSGKPTDLIALLNWVNAILAQFQWTTTDEGPHERLKVTLPVSPYGDLMKSLSQGQMKTFQGKLESLRDALQDAYNEDLPEDACKLLNKQFGDEFRVPAKADTARAVVAPVISTGNSA
ncbi:MAG TPA: nucleotidyltransferase [Burkholderiales bacterium]|nr:nucleotidyltransferase [Burkholderiales bacterium]